VASLWPRRSRDSGSFASRPRAHHVSSHSASSRIVAQIFDFTLTDEDLEELGTLGRTRGTDVAVESKLRRS
jgi:hypothetical protein